MTARTWTAADPEPPAGIDVLADRLPDWTAAEPYLCRLTDGTGWEWRYDPAVPEGVIGSKSWAVAAELADGPLSEVAGVRVGA